MRACHLLLAPAALWACCAAAAGCWPRDQLLQHARCKPALRAPGATAAAPQPSRRYELPRFVLCDPSNLSPDPVPGKDGAGPGTGGQLELPAVAGSAATGPSSPDSAHLPEDAPLNQVAVR